MTATLFKFRNPLSLPNLKYIHSTASMVSAILGIVLLGFGFPATASNTPPAEFLKACELLPREEGQPKVKAWCGDFAVAEDLTDTNSATITLPIVYIPATDPIGRPPIFVLGGGPGASNIYTKHRKWKYRNHDLIMVGYRGADGSHILNCPDIKTGQLGDGENLVSNTSKDLFATAAQECVSQLESKGLNLANYTMMQVISDIEAARIALGFNQINLLSESYGTRVAQIYGYEHPSVIARSVMIGVNPPGHFVWQPAVIDEQIHQLANLCRANQYCRQQTDALDKTFQNISHNMEKSWLLFPIDSGKVRFLAMNFLHNRNGAATVIRAFLAAEKGDASGLALLSLAYDLQIKYGDPQPIGDLLSKGMVDYDPQIDYSALFDLKNSIMGSAMSELLMSAGPAWPQAPFPKEYLSPQPTAVNTLMINGTIDFSTPYQNAERELLPLYENGHLVKLEGLGHLNDVYANQPEALDHLVSTYLLHGKVDASKFQPRGIDIEAGVNLPAIMKALVAGIVLGVIILGTLFYWLFIKIKRRFT